MIRGVRKPEEARALGLSRRLMVRLGALLKKSVEITPAVLEAAKPGTPLEILLLDPQLLDRAQALDTQTLENLASAHLPPAAAALDLAVVPSDGGSRVICLREEVEGGEGWDASEAPPQAAAAPDADAVLPMPLFAQGASGSSGTAGSEALFTRLELDKLRLKLVTAASAAERIEALRILAHAPLSPHEKAEAIFIGLDDREAAVRGGAAELLFVLGAEADLGESLRALGQEQREPRLRAAERLVKRISGSAKDLERGAAAVGALAALKVEADGAISAALIQLLSGCATALVRNPSRLAELARVVLGKLAAASDRSSDARTAELVFTPAHRLFRALGKAAPEIVLPLLRAEREKATDVATDAFLLEMLLDLQPPGSPGAPEALRQCAAFLAQDTQESRESRTIGMSLAAHGEQALLQLAGAFSAATPGAQKYFLRLMDDIVRFQKPSPEAKELAAGCLLHALESGARGLRMVAMHCRCASDQELSESIRGKLARCILNACSDFGFKTDIEIAEDGLARIGLPALAPLLERIGPASPAEARVQAVRILGALALELKAPRGQMRRTAEALTQVLRDLQALRGELEFPDRGALHAAMGKIASSPAVSRQAVEVVVRNLLQATGDGEKLSRIGALEGLTWLGAARHADPQLIATVSGLIRNAMDQAHTELVSETREVDGEKVIEITQGEDLVVMLPIAFAGISRIVRSGSCPPAFAREMVQFLLGRWRKIVTGEMVWGPANAMEAVRALKEIGCHPGLADELRMEILKALAPRLIQAPVLQAVGAILSGADGPPTCAAALTLGLAVAGRRQSDGRYDPEDRPDILRAAGRIAARRHLGTPDEKGREQARRFREQVVEDLFHGAKDLVAGAAEELVRIREAKVLPQTAQESLERRLADMHALAVY